MANEQRTLQANFTANASGFASGASEAISKLRELNTQVVETKQKIKETNSELKAHEKELANLKKSTNDGANATAEQRKRMQELEDAIARCKVDLGAYATTQQRLQSDIRNTNRELDDQRKATNELTQSFSSFGDVLKGSLASDVILSAVSQITNMLQMAAANVYAVGSSFEAGMSRVEAISGATGESLEALTEKAKMLGATTRFTATEATEAMNYMAMAGWDATQMLAGIDGVLSLAAASGEDLGTTADIITDALTAFGMKAEEVGHFADVLAAASANANTNVGMLGESFKYVAPLAGTMGFTIDEVAEALGIMANSGIKASTAGTSLRTMLTNLSSGVTLETEALGKMEISAANADGSMRSLNEVLGDLRVAFAQMTDAEQTANAKIIAGDRALSGFLALVNASETDINKLRGAIEECGDSAATMADTMQDNVAGSVTVMSSAIEGLWLAVYERMKDGIGDTVDTITDKVSELTAKITDSKLGDSMEQFADGFGEFAEEVIDLVSDVLPVFLNSLTTVLNILVDNRQAITSTVAAIVAFKAAMAMGNIIQTTVAAIKAFNLATELATIKQAAFNAVADVNPYVLLASALAALVVGITTFINSAGNAEDELKKLRAEVENLNSEAEKSKEEAEAVSELADEYETLGKKAEKTADEKARLQKIQDELVNKYGLESSELDLVNGKYEEQIAILQRLEQQKSGIAAANAQRAYNDMEYAEQVEANRSASWNLGEFGERLDDAEQRRLYNALNKDSILPWLQLDTSDETDASLNLGIKINGNTKQKRAAYEQLIQAMQNSGLSKNGSYEMKQLFGDIVAEYNALAETDNINDIIRRNYNASNTSDTAAPGSLTAHHNMNADKSAKEQAQADYEAFKIAQQKKAEQAQKDKDAMAALYKEEKQLADDMYSVGEISAEEYYNRLKILRDTYLTQGTHEWYSATAQLQSVFNKIGSAADKMADTVKGALDAVKSEFQKTLDALDDELKEHDRALEDEELQKKIDNVKRRLEYEQLDDYSKRALEKELADLEKEKEETAYQRSKADAKQALRNASANASDLLAALPAGYDTSAAITAAQQMAQAIANTTTRTDTNSILNSLTQPVVKNYYFTLSNNNKSDEQFFSELYRAATKDHI